jgi:hypothetical protein
MNSKCNIKAHVYTAQLAMAICYQDGCSYAAVITRGIRGSKGTFEPRLTLLSLC